MYFPASRGRLVVPGIFIAAFLVASLLLVHFSIRQEPLPSKRPLNVEHGLPLPEVGQASTVFSLTALFGAYLGIFVVLGWPALIGLAIGSGAGLLFIRLWLNRSRARSFESFLYGLFVGGRQNVAVFGLLIVGIQCCFATSEVLILREIARATLGLSPGQSTLVALALTLIGYFYVLIGGYRAVFRTDIVQFVFVAAMGVSLLVSSPAAAQADPMIRWPRPGYWELPMGHSGDVLKYLYQLVVAAVMGFTFLVASPDAWKRVFVVTMTKRARRRFTTFLVAGISPFVVLLPFASRIPGIPDGPVSVGEILASLLGSNALFVSVALGLIASFLSAFNGALLAAVQVGIILRRVAARDDDETPRFHWLMVAALVVVSSLFVALLSIPNPYLLASLLLGPYVLVSGILLGTRAALSRLREGVLLWIVVVGTVGWFAFVISDPSVLLSATMFQLNAVPGGILLCLAVAAVCFLASIGRKPIVRLS